MGPEPAMGYVRRAVCSMLYADVACIFSRSPRRLTNKMEVIVEIFRAFTLIVWGPVQRLEEGGDVTNLSPFW